MMKITYINHQKLIDDQYVKEINDQLKNDEVLLLSEKIETEVVGVRISGTMLITSINE